MSFFASYPSGGGVLSINGLTGAVTLAAGTNITLVPSGNTITINSTAGGGGANTSLSNLSAVAINTDLLPDTTSAYTLGTSGQAWAGLFSPFISADASNSLMLLSQNNSVILRAAAGTEIAVRNASATAAVPVRFYDDAVDNYIGLKAPSDVTVDLDYVLPVVDGSSGDVLSTDGAGVMSWITPAASGANTALSNLAAVDLNQDLTTTKASNLLVSHQAATFAVSMLTANNGAGNSGAVTLQTGTASGTRGDINLNARQTNFTGSLLPSAAATYAVGSTALRLADVVTERVQIRDGIDRLQLIINGQAPSVGAGVFNAFRSGVGENLAIYSSTNGSGASGPVYLESGKNQAASGTTNTGLLNIQTGDLTNAGNAGNSGNVRLASGNIAGVGASGNVTLAVGTGAVRGDIIFVDGSEGTAGHVWTSTGTGGQGAWSSVPASVLANNTYFKARNAANSADVDLFKLDASDVLRFDAPIWPSTDSTKTLGDPSARFSTIYSNNSEFVGTGPYVYVQDDGASQRYIQLYASETPYITPGGDGSFTSIHCAVEIGDGGNAGVFTYDGGSLELWTRDDGAGSGMVIAGSGDTTTNNSGDVLFRTGINNATGGSVGSGALTIQTGAVTNAANTGLTGSILVQTGNNASVAGSGDFTVNTGTSDGQAGSIFLNAGNGLAGGNLSLSAGDSQAGNGGGVFNFTSGDGQPSGAISFTTGNGVGTDANCGIIQMVSGTPTGTGYRTYLNTASLDFIQMPVNAADPTNPALQAGAMYYDSTLNKLKMYNGATWETVTSI